MIRLRTNTGEHLDLADSTSFVEICDQEGKVALVFYSPEDCAISEIVPNSHEANLYSKRFDVEFVGKIHDLKDRYEDE